MPEEETSSGCPPGPKHPSLYPTGPSGERIRPCMACKDTREARDQLEGETVNMLNAIVQLMTGSGEFDRHIY